MERVSTRCRPGDPAWIHGRVLSLDGAPIAGAEIDVWQNGDNELYATLDPEAPEAHLRGRCTTREDGSFGFIAVRPTAYPIPDDGPVGQMLRALRSDFVLVRSDDTGELVDPGRTA